MQLYYFLAIILSLSFGSLPQSDHSLQHAVTFTLLIIAVWWGLCMLSVRMVGGLIQQGEVSVDVGYHWFDRQTEWLRWFSLALIALCLGGFGLARNLDQIPVIRHSLFLQALLLLAPAVAMMSGLWAAEYGLAAKLGWVPRGIAVAVGSIWTAFRGSAGWLLAPIVGVMMAIDLATAASLGTRLPEWAGWLVLAMVVIVGIPPLVRRVFPTAAMEPATQQWVESLVAAAGLPRCKIVLWDSSGRIHNALIAGLAGRFRILVLSDRLVADLTRPQLAMVILHEVAHARRFHIPLRILALVPAWLLGAGVERMIAQSTAAGWSAAGGSVASILGTVLVLRWVSYRSEFDADAVACRMAPRLASQCVDVPETATAAAEQLGQALLRVTIDSDAARKPTWLHPGISDRIQAFSPGQETGESAISAG
ncbi:M48 family metalloprotease [Stieleria sp. TO1_6]|uniref:M48 family metalloprotease n=1 Tax=Stieleria tagensis TaxID=2956795 RepID=UPI00209B4968|nr:M48 family metalloprotease [Stieleria tagensis]MCO8124634.1 M48 family metalloprotease [Stieleria tagensis]